MIHIHEAILRVYPNTDLCVEYLQDGTTNTLVWNGNSYDPFTYDEAKVKTAHDAIVIEHQWSDLRKQRDKLLAETDWTQVSDSPLSSDKKTEWANYRTALRDLPTASGWPNVDMPNTSVYIT